MTLTQNASTQATITPDAALAALVEGNQRFQQGERIARDYRAQIQDTRAGQWPFAAVLSCIDSRVSPELVFDTGIGDVFAPRIAGNFVNEDILGSLEFACHVAGSKLIVVLGHTHCGAIKGACDNVQLGNLTSLIGKLTPAVQGVAEPTEAAQRTSSNPDFVQAVAQRNIGCTVAAIRERSSILKDMEQEGAIRIVGAMYDVETGAVSWES